MKWCSRRFPSHKANLPLTCCVVNFKFHAWNSCKLFQLNTVHSGFVCLCYCLNCLSFLNIFLGGNSPAGGWGERLRSQTHFFWRSNCPHVCVCFVGRVSLVCGAPRSSPLCSVTAFVNLFTACIPWLCLYVDARPWISDKNWWSDTAEWTLNCSI